MRIATICPVCRGTASSTIRTLSSEYGVYENSSCSECPYSKLESERSRADSAKIACDSCRANRVCDHTRFGYETCGNYIPMLGGKLNENP